MSNGGFCGFWFVFVGELLFLLLLLLLLLLNGSLENFVLCQDGGVLLNGIVKTGKPGLHYGKRRALNVLGCLVLH